MKLSYSYLLPIILLIVWSESYAQKEDYHWILGYSGTIPSVDTNFGRAELVFDDKVLKVKKTSEVVNKLNFTNASICDSMGKLLCYTNGLEVYNKEYQIMPNGDDLNPGEIANISEQGGYTQHGVVLFLPWPEHTQNYFLIHKTTDRVPFIWYSLNLLTTLIDMNRDSGNGDVIYKNKSIYADSLINGSITACRHANGRDWWIPCFYYRGGKCFIFLLDPSGIRLHHVEDIPFEFSPSGNGQAQFSPDGSKFAFLHFCSQNYRELFYADFDRCNGVFSAMNYYTYPEFGLIGIAFSPNNRFLYFGTGNELFQLDFHDNKPYDNRIKIDSIDGFQSFPGFTSYFHLMQLGPDDKIYICNGRSPSYLSSINSPDLKGKACDVRQHNVSIVANSTMPNFPYFRLGALKGSSCDTIGLVGTTIIEKNNQCKINYNRNIIEIEDPQQKINAAIIYTINGIEMNRYEFNQPSTQETINIEHLFNGIYFLELKDKKGIKTIQKLIVQY